MKVRVEPEVTVGALDDGDGAALAVDNASGRLPLAIVGRDGVGEDAQNLAQQFSVEGQRKAQGKRHGEHELSDRDFWQDAAQPSWINNSNAAAVAPIWMKSFCDRYPKTRVIDVVNEPLHTSPAYKEGLGGPGTSGFDWIVNSFKWAHEACPNAILILNEYNIIEYSSEHKRIIDLAKAILAAGAPIMALGAQAHDVAKVPLSTVQAYLADIVSQTGLPVYITELDLGIADDVQQATTMKDLVTTFWNDPNVPGVTYWGYIVGATWRSNTGLMTSAGVMRPAMTWLMDFLHR